MRSKRRNHSASFNAKLALAAIRSTQFTSDAFTGVPKAASIQIGMDSKRRWEDNAFVERLRRSMKIRRRSRRVLELVVFEIIDLR